MLYFLDSADFSLIADTIAAFPVDGVTTNPAILARDLPAGCSVGDGLGEIRRLTEGLLLFVQATAADADGMVRDAHAICRRLGGRISIKLPATVAGFTAAKRLSAEGISVTMTAVYSTSQAMLAGACGADFCAPYVSHLDNLSLDGAGVAAEMARQLSLHGRKTQVLAASFRTASQVERCLAGGVTAVTITADMFGMLAAHPGTMTERASFDAKWNARFGGAMADLI